MAAGDFHIFEEFAAQSGGENHNFSSDVLKAGLVDDTLTPLVTIASPTWGDYSANEVGTGGGYTANGETVTGVTYTEVGGVATLDCTHFVDLAQNASGFTDARWMILYNDTNGTDMAIGFMDLGANISEVAGPIVLDQNVSGILTITVTP